MFLCSFTSNYHKLVSFQWKKNIKKCKKKSDFHVPVLSDWWLDGKFHRNSKFCRVFLYFFTAIHVERPWKCPWKLLKCPWKSPWKVLEFFSGNLYSPWIIIVHQWFKWWLGTRISHCLNQWWSSLLKHVWVIRLVELTHWGHWGRDKMDAILQTPFWSAFSWMKMFEFRLKFHWSLFLRVQLTIFQHWFR